MLAALRCTSTAWGLTAMVVCVLRKGWWQVRCPWMWLHWAVIGSQAPHESTFEVPGAWAFCTLPGTAYTVKSMTVIMYGLGQHHASIVPRRMRSGMQA